MDTGEGLTRGAQALVEDVARLFVAGDAPGTRSEAGRGGDPDHMDGKTCDRR
ncbi:MAG TPA: hypothetical protein VK283_02325 [Acidimicrobiales bacterium]|nr:hypothetical protein [Acidimicrobiales bacterium]